MTAFVAGVKAGLVDCISGILSIPRLDSDILEAWERHRRNAMGALARRRQPEQPTAEERKRKSLINLLKSRWKINFVFVFITIVVFNYVVLPSMLFLSGLIFSHDFVDFIQNRVVPLLSYIFQGLWVIPLIVLMEVVNTKFYMDISNLVYTVHRRKTERVKASMSFLISDRVFSIAVLTAFMLQTRVIRFAPIGSLVELSYLLHLSQLYAFYAFEYRWCFEGLPFEKRLAEMEANWNYFLGFGLPLALLTWLAPNFVMSALAVYMVFPLYIISAQQARRHRLNRMASPLRLFRPSVYLVDFAFHTACSWFQIGCQPPPPAY